MSKAIVLLGDLGSDHEGFPPTPVIAGSPDVLIDGKPAARVGDPLAPHSKPKHPPHPRTISGGSSTVMINGKPAAVTGGAISCGGVTIGSGSVVIGDTHTPASFSGVSPVTARTAVSSTTAAESVQTAPERVSSTGRAEPMASPTNSSSATEPGTTSAVNTTHPGADEKPALSEPGFHVVREPMGRNELLSQLYGDASAKPENFERLNPGLGDRVLPGEMIVIADPESLECTLEENDLMAVAAEVNEEVRQLSEQEAQFIVDHYDLLELMTANAATGMGVGAAMVGQQIKSVNGILKELEKLHQSTFRKYGKLSHPEFFDRRQKLFTKLDFALGRVVRKGMSLGDDAKLKRALGLSSKSIVHEWKSAGVGGIPGYATHYSKLAGMGKVVQGTGYGLLLVDAGLGVANVAEACTLESDQACEAALIEEPSKLGGAYFGAQLGSKLGGACVLLGITTGVGGVACVVVATGVGSFSGGYLGSKGGAIMGTKIREVIVDD
ncbi:MAG: type VI secretion system PAAR protein [Marinobacter sp.]|nr:type VI secretion system PAAR protein [Marinobacter sp.]